MINFDGFTNRYSLSKTLRFELKPIENTPQMLEEDKIFEQDDTIQKKYRATKPYIDRLHREFIQEALTNAYLENLNEEYFELLKKYKNDKKTFEKELQTKEKALRKEIVSFFNGQGKIWANEYSGMKKKDIEILFEEAIFENILKKRYGHEIETMISDESTGLDTSIFDSWKGFTGYFGKFFETRKNFYKDDGTSTALATRMIDQNLKRFCDNMILFQSLKDKIDFTEVENTFGKSLLEIFSLEFYNSCLLQNGIDFYNKILGGEVLGNGEKIKGLNECINLHRQKTSEKIVFFKLLDKQILSEKETIFIDEIEDDKELLSFLKVFSDASIKHIYIFKNLLTDFIENQPKYNLEQIYLSKEAWNTITHRWSFDTEILENALYEILKKEKIVSSSARKKEGGYSFPEFISLNHIKKALELKMDVKLWKERYETIPLFDIKSQWEQFLSILKFEFLSLFESTTPNNEIIGYNKNEKLFHSLLENFELNADSKMIIKNFADSTLNIYQLAKYFAIEKKRAWNNDYELDVFYTDPNNGYLQFYENAYEDIVQAYNKIRNYLTKKAYIEEKWKLNFKNPTLADGWDKNKESDNSAVLLKKGNQYFLGIMSKGNNKIFDDKYIPKFQENLNDNKYEKVVYKLLPGANKMLPKVFFSDNNIHYYDPSENILRIRNHASHAKNGKPQAGYEKHEFDLKDCHDLIDFFKISISKHTDWKHFDFKFSDTNNYQDISGFYREVENGGYNISFQNISEQYIHEKNRNKELYLFQIKNKDWNDGSSGAKNLHTLYFESVFSLENKTHNFPIKLNGQAEIFYRPKTEASNLEIKQDKQGKNVINHKRYSENKIFFHVPITLNRTVKSNPSQFNKQINTFLANDPDINIIGVDRGEKHLAYYSVINQKGEILDSGSLNSVGQDESKSAVDYAEKLAKLADSREKARKDWQTIEGIKNLKKGYISQVVHKLADLIIEHNAIIIFEDLNMRFKQIRGGIEKSIYQQLEKALIDKLNFLVKKGEKDPEEAGHLLKAYQLTAPFETFKDMGKQTGVIFYTQAAYTSKIDPVTGWRPHLYLKYSSAQKAKEDILKFSKIEWIQNRFEFTYNIKIFQTNNKEYPKNTLWTVCSNVERYRWNQHLNNNKGDYEYYADVSHEFINLFEEYQIDFKHGDIIGQIDELETKGKEQFFKNFIFLFNLVCQIRNTNNKEVDTNKQDFILSPVMPFFDTRKTNSQEYPKNGDDNGAYNIARKGIILLKKLSDHAEKDPEFIKYPELYVSNIEWDNFIYKK